MSLAAPGTNPASNLELKLPHTIGSANQLLKVDGNGQLGWATDSTTDSTKLPLSGGTLSGHLTVNGEVITSDDININADNKKLNIGTGADLQLYHDSSSDYSYIEHTHATGHLVIRNTGADSNIYLQARLGEQSIVCHDDGAVELYNNGNLSATTASDDFDVYRRLRIHADRSSGMGGHLLAIGQWDGSNHRIEGDANRPIFITTYNSGGIRFGYQASERLRISSSGHMSLGGGADPSSTNGGIGLKFGIKSSANNILIGETTSSSHHGLLIESRLTGRSGGARTSQINVGQDGTGGQIILYTSPSSADVKERLRITAGGVQNFTNSSADNHYGQVQVRHKTPYSSDGGYPGSTQSTTNQTIFSLYNESYGGNRMAFRSGQGHQFEIETKTRDLGSGSYNDADVYFRGQYDGALTDRYIIESGGSHVWKIRNGDTALNIDGNGVVKKPLQPSFSAYRSSSAWTVNASTEMVFDSTRHNAGSHYSTSTGRFTAPQTGSYFFSFYSIFNTNVNSASVKIYKNGSRLYGGDIHFTYDQSGHWHNVSFSQVLQLAVNDYVSIFNGGIQVNYHGNHWQLFSGYLLG